MSANEVSGKAHLQVVSQDEAPQVMRVDPQVVIANARHLCLAITQNVNEDSTLRNIALNALVHLEKLDNQFKKRGLKVLRDALKSQIDESKGG